MRELHTDRNGRMTSYESRKERYGETELNLDAIIDWTAAIVIIGLIVATIYLF